MRNGNDEEAEKKIMKANDKVSKMNESANDYLPKVQHESNERNEERVEKIVQGWINPAKHVPIIFFFKKHKTEVEDEESKNRF